jgi:hypothetical protein
MPRTPPTIVAPLPNDPRVFALAKASGLTSRESFACAAEAWAWISVMAVDDIVVNTAPDSLDAVVDVPGFGQAMLKVGLVGTVDGGLVLPAELRRRQSERRGGAAAAGAEDSEERKEQERKANRIRKRRSRANKALTKPATKDTSAAPSVDTGMKRTPRRLGFVDVFPVMLLFSRQGVPFYKLAGSSPKEWTGTVTDPENPSYADALVALHAAMKREGGKGLGGSDSFRPSLKAMVDEAERYRTARAANAADDARRDEANRAAAEAAAEDREDIDHEPAERDCHAHVTPSQRDTVTVTEVSRPESVTCPPNSNGGGDLGNGECHAPVTVTAPSSSSSLSVSGFHEDKSKENTTTTSSVTPAERDNEDRILERLVPRVEPEQARQQSDEQRWLERIAQALGTTPEAVKSQRQRMPDILLARLKAAGIDPKTCEPVTAEGSHKPVGARGDTVAIAEPMPSDKPAAGSVDAQGDDARLEDEDVDRPRHDPWRTVMALKQNGIPLPMLNVAPGRGHRLEDIDFEQHEQASAVTARDLA